MVLRLRHTHVWGCHIETRLYNPHEKKLDPRTICGYIIGYLERSKGYMFYCPNHSPRIVTIGNEKFIELDEFSGSRESRDVITKEVQVDVLISIFFFRKGHSFT